MVKRLSGNWLFVLLALLVLALGIAAAGKLTAQPVRAAPDVGTNFTCTPDLVVSANVRVVARCSVAYTSVSPAVTIIWFAYPTSDSANASRMLSVFESAKATGSTITVYFDNADTSGTAYGCLASDCRAIWAVTTP